MPVARYSDAEVDAGATRLDPIGVRVEFAFVLALLLAMIPLYLRTLSALWRSVENAQMDDVAKDGLSRTAAPGASPVASPAHQKVAQSVGGGGFVPQQRPPLARETNWQMLWAHDTARTASIHLASLLCQLPWMLAVLILADDASINRHGWNSVLCAFALCVSLLCRWRVMPPIVTLFRSLERVLDKSPEARLGIAFQLRLSKISVAAFLVLGPICACACLALNGFFSEETSESLLLAYLAFQSVQLFLGPFTAIKLLGTMIGTLTNHADVLHGGPAPTKSAAAVASSPAGGPSTDVALAIDSPRSNAVAPAPPPAGSVPPPTPAQLLYLQATARLVAAKHAAFPSMASFVMCAIALLIPYTRERYTYFALIVNVMPQIGNYKQIEAMPKVVVKRKQ